MKKFFTILFLIPCAFGFSQIAGPWELAPQAGALSVGPGRGDASWWSNTAGDVTTRACLFDDRFAFNSNGTFNNLMDTTTWLETWQGVAAEECGTPVAPHDGSNSSATWSFDSTTMKLTISGVGAHIGIPKAINNGELSDTTLSPPDSIVYDIMLSSDKTVMYADIMVREVGAAEEGWWRFILCKDGNCGVDDIGQSGGDTSSINLNQKLNFRLTPNPATDQIAINNTIPLDNVSIRNLAGQNMVTKTNVSPNSSINVADLPRGIYVIEYRSEGRTSFEKFILK